MVGSGMCPRCNVALMARYGALGEDVCPECDGRLLSPELTRRVLIEEGGVSAELVHELAAHFAGKRLRCPACAGEMSPITVKGTPIDVCLGCGATFLDAGELAQLSAGRHGEVIAPPTLVRSADHNVALEEAEPDPRATWEKAMPMYAIESVVVFGVVSHLKPSWTSLHALGVSLALVGLPLGASMLADTDLRSMFRARGRGFHLGARGRGAGGVVLFALAIAIGGTISTVNAMIAERLPRKVARAVTFGSLATVAVWAGLKALL